MSEFRGARSRGGQRINDLRAQRSQGLDSMFHLDDQIAIRVSSTKHSFPEHRAAGSEMHPGREASS